MTSSMNNPTVAWPCRNQDMGFQSAFAFRNTVTIRLYAAKCCKFVLFNIHVKQEILPRYAL